MLGAGVVFFLNEKKAFEVPRGFVGPEMWIRGISLTIALLQAREAAMSYFRPIVNGII